jgi:lipopolysaccharide transport system ATP-binding protein
MSEAIVIENLSKRYRLGTISHGLLFRDLQAAWARLRGKEDPHRKIGEHNRFDADEFWALDEVSFAVPHGQVLGIIGRNGAGKSTLLKVLSRITAPTSGRIKVRGRIASLLEVGTGFHPELTGRENIFLNGAILGMSRYEINRKFEEIVSFSGIQRFIDTPVKRYSSGMYVRLAFAVAAHLEPEILVIDEVLAVGDAEFQKKCIGKMGEVAKAGRTVLFVSHNMAAVSNLCDQVLYLAKGKIVEHGSTEKVIDTYLRKDRSESPQWSAQNDSRRFGDHCVTLNSVAVLQDSTPINMPAIASPIQIEVEYTLFVVARLKVSIQLFDQNGTCVLASANFPSAMSNVDPIAGQEHSAGKYKTVCTIPADFLNETTYSITVVILSDIHDVHLIADEIISFTTLDNSTMRRDYTGPWMGIVRPRLDWRTEQIAERSGLA